MSGKKIRIDFACLIFFALSILIEFKASAASFDCRKAEERVEKIICSDRGASQLDEQLSSVYKEVVRSEKDPGKIISSQRKWILEERNSCLTTGCVIDVYRARIKLLKSSFGIDACNIKEQQLLGSWVRLEGGDFEEMKFFKENGKYYFSSWLHHQPEFFGEWKLQECKLHIANRSGMKIDFEYEVIAAQGNILKLKNDDGESAIYRRAGLD